MPEYEKTLKISKEELQKMIERKYLVEIINITLSSHGVKCSIK